MSLQTSLYLDLLRFLAAMVVFIGHLAGQRFTEGLFWQFSLYMDEAVIIFFVLSGFVIAHVTHDREVLFKDYFIARAARMYSVAFPALVLTFFLDYFGKISAPQLYNEAWGYKNDLDFESFGLGLLFLNQIWFSNIQIGSMLPYWSLGYEVWYYAIFAAFFFAEGRRRLLLVSVLILFVGPKIAVMLPIWFFGYFSYKFIHSELGKNIGNHCLLVLYSCSFFLAFLYLMSKANHEFFYIETSWLDRRSIVLDYLVAIIFSMNIIGFSGLPNISLNLLKKLSNPIKWIAGATFTIYLLHLPIAQFLIAIWPNYLANFPMQLFLIPFAFICILVIAELTERRKGFWLKAINHMFVRRASIT